MTDSWPSTPPILHDLPTDEDIRILSHQLRRPSDKVQIPEEIVYRCSHGYPCVVFASIMKQNRTRTRARSRLNADDSGESSEAAPAEGSLTGKKRSRETGGDSSQAPSRKQQRLDSSRALPVPGTLFWLTCPRISNWIDRLEATGFQARLRETYCTDEAERSVVEIHREFESFLREFLSAKNRVEVFEKWQSSNRNDGVRRRFGNAGESEEKYSLKCLHAHMAPFLLGVRDDIARDTLVKGLQENDIEDSGNVRDFECPMGQVCSCAKFPEAMFVRKGKRVRS